MLGTKCLSMKCNPVISLILSRGDKVHVHVHVHALHADLASIPKENLGSRLHADPVGIVVNKYKAHDFTMILARKPAPPSRNLSSY